MNNNHLLNVRLVFSTTSVLCIVYEESKNMREFYYHGGGSLQLKERRFHHETAIPKYQTRMLLSNRHQQLLQYHLQS